MKATMRNALIAIILPLSASAAFAQSALSALKTQAGPVAVADAQDQIAPIPSVSPAAVASPAPKADIFDKCSSIDINFSLNHPLTMQRGLTLPEAVAATRRCLDRTYNANAQPRSYNVSVIENRFAVRACPPVPGRVSCMAMKIVDGIQISVTGRVPEDDTVLGDLRSALAKRGGKLLGYPVTVVAGPSPQVP